MTDKTCARILALVAVLLFAGQAMALPKYWAAFKSHYSISDASHIGKLKCMTCHGDAGPPVRNPFGKQVEAALGAANSDELTPAILDKVALESAADDGVANGTKIKADEPPALQVPVSGSAPETKDPMGGFPTHAFHPALVHFPIVLVMLAAFFEVVGRIKKLEKFREMSFVNAALACISYPFVIGTGFFTWFLRYQLSGDRTILLHMGCGLAGFVVMGAATLGEGMRRRAGSTTPSVLYLILLAIAVVCVGVGGNLGGVVSGVG